MEDVTRISLVNRSVGWVVFFACSVAVLAFIWLYSEAFRDSPLKLLVPGLPIGAILGYGLYRYFQHAGKYLRLDHEGIRLEKRSRVLGAASWGEVDGYAFRQRKRESYFEIDRQGKSPISIRIGYMTFDSATELQLLIRELDRRMDPDAVRDRPPRPDDRIGKIFYDAYNDPKPVEMVEGIWYRYLDPVRVRKEASLEALQCLMFLLVANVTTIATAAKDLILMPLAVIVFAFAWLALLPRFAVLLSVRRWADAEFMKGNGQTTVRTGKVTKTFPDLHARCHRKHIFMLGELSRFGPFFHAIWLHPSLLVPSSDYIPIEVKRANKAQALHRDEPTHDRRGP